MNYDNTQMVIDLDAISHNIDAIRKKAGIPVMAIIKADAYGHGAIPIAHLLESRCAFFGVSSMLEAMELRHAGIEIPILILGYTPPGAFPDAIKYHIRPAIFHYEDAEALSRAAVKAGCIADFHFVADTGMSRIGFQVTQEDADICAAIAKLPGLRAEGLFSHFATADCSDLTRTEQQAKLFFDFDQMLRDRGVEIPLRHLDNSAGIMNYPHRCEMVRSGIITYGMYPSAEVDPSLLNLQSPLTWRSRITHIKLLPAGREISYGGTYITPAPTMVATIPVGYADGYRRNLSGKFYVLIEGKKAPILGRVCMDQLMADITDIPQASLDSEVILIGKSGQEQITVEQIAAEADSFNYEFVCGISRRVPRIYTSDGRIINAVRYLLDT